MMSTTKQMDYSAVTPPSIHALVVFALVAALGLAGCADKKSAVKDFDAEGTNDATAANVKKGIKPVPDTEVAVIETADFGNIVIDLYPNIAPKMVERFKKLISEGFYNGTTFHRVNAATGLIQGGDPLSKDNHAALTDEQARDTANCQFFITLNQQPEFDEDYTVFGEVIQGINNADVIMRAPVVEESERPEEKIVIKSITLQPRFRYVPQTNPSL